MSLIEIMFAIAIIGVLAAIAIPVFTSYQLRSKTAEAKTDLGVIQTLEHTYFAEHDVFLTVVPEPPALPGTTTSTFNEAAGFFPLGFSPEGKVFFSYGVSVSVDQTGYTADAGGDLDGDGFPQFWGFAMRDGGGALTMGQVGCNPAGLKVEQVGPCSPNFGQSVF